MPVPIRVVLLLSLPLVRADFWDDFSNNLATDLAPLLSLIGERVTMQYLSESITFLDYFIFAMAPMGILTALVSAIRVCGSPSLRAFIGRAQEGAGTAEAELCSSTSRNVCELYNNGGIARVFGRPKILEVVHDPEVEVYELVQTGGLYTFQDFIKTKNGQALWKEVGARADMESQVKDIDNGPFAPNLSLNVGIKRQSDTIFWGVAIFGAILQIGVLVYAGIITYYLQWKAENSSSVEYACPMAIIGTLLVCSGVFYCAYLVGESTNEQVYCRSSSTGNSQGDTKAKSPALYWLQPGGQVIGDQTFDAFCYSDRKQPLQKYLISWKPRSEEKKRRIWEAVTMTTIGFVMQFIGLRGIHPTASIAQLGAIIVMSAARASMRMQRLKPRDNFLVDCPDEVIGYELDCLALRIGRDDIQTELQQSRQGVSDKSTEDRREFLHLCGTAWARFDDFAPYEISPYRVNTADKLLAYRRRLAELTESTGLESNQANSTRQFRDDMVKVKPKAKQLIRAMESAISLINADTSGFSLCAEDTLWWKVYCSISTRTKSDNPQNNASSQKTLPVHIHLYESKYPSWRLDKPLEIEAILGLWVWSLVSDFGMETQNKYDNVNLSRAFEVSINRIVSTHKDYPDLDLWVGTSLGVHNAVFACKDAQSARPADVFTVKLTDSYSREYICEPLVSDLPQDLGSRSRVARYFGWHNIKIPDTGSDDLTLATTSVEGLVSCCSHEIFGLFIKSLVAQVSIKGHISVEENDGIFYLSHTLLNDLIEIFVGSGLGSKKDAWSCVLPVMFPYLRSPPIEHAFQLAVATLKKYCDSKKRDEWRSRSAVTLLRWAWEICKQPLREGEVRQKDYPRLCVMTLGELYRLALLDDWRDKFGRDGIEWLRDESRDQSETCCESIQCYSAVLEALDQTKTGRQTLRVGDNPTIVSSLLSLTLSSDGLAQTPKIPVIYEAAGLGWTEVVLASLASGADPDLACKDMRLETPLCNAAKNGHAQVVDILIEWGASQYCRTSDGFSALDLAVLNGHHVIVKSLLDTFDPSLVSDCRGESTRGKTTLHIAAEQKDEEMIRLLVWSDKFDCESRDADGATPLHLATKSPYGETARLSLLMWEHNKNIRDNNGMTPLDHALASGKGLDIVEFIARKSSEETRAVAMRLAKGRGDDKVVDLLTQIAEQSRTCERT